MAIQCEVCEVTGSGTPEVVAEQDGVTVWADHSITTFYVCDGRTMCEDCYGEWQYYAIDPTI